MTTNTDPKPYLLLRSEIRNAITAAELALEQAERAGATFPPGYRDGHKAALLAAAVTLGVELPQDRRQ